MKFLNVRARKFHFPKYKEFSSGGIFLLFKLGLKKCTRWPYKHYLVNRKNLSKDLEYICNMYEEKFLLGYAQPFS